MLSLLNSVEPKYIGPSSGVTFARLIYAAVPGSQGLSLNLSDSKQDGGHSPAPERSTGASLPNIRDMHRFLNAYFETTHILYPFLNVATFSKTAEKIRRFPVQQPQSCIDLSRSDGRAIDYINHA